jgi:hypothetical protein
MVGAEWINLAQDRSQWRIVVKSVITSMLRKRLGLSWLTERLKTSEGLSSVEL